MLKEYSIHTQSKDLYKLVYRKINIITNLIVIR